MAELLKTEAYKLGSWFCTMTMNIHCRVLYY